MSNTSLRADVRHIWSTSVSFRRLKHNFVVCRLADQMIRIEIRRSLSLPFFDENCSVYCQIQLFNIVFITCPLIWFIWTSLASLQYRSFFSSLSFSCLPSITFMYVHVWPISHCRDMYDSQSIHTGRWMLEVSYVYCPITSYSKWLMNSSVKTNMFSAWRVTMCSFLSLFSSFTCINVKPIESFISLVEEVFFMCLSISFLRPRTNGQ